MVTILIIIGILIVIIVGFLDVYNRHSTVIENIVFAREYREKFVDFANKYSKTFGRGDRSGDFDGEIYVWLTMNVSKIQGLVGGFGVMSYKPAFQNYLIDNYQIIINTLPKFRAGQVENFDIGAVDDCLLRYIGHLKEYEKVTLKNLKNPIIWFREGFRAIFSFPLLILNWFGVFSSSSIKSIMNSAIYKIIAGFLALVSLVSGLVTIIVGYDQTIGFINRFLGR